MAPRESEEKSANGSKIKIKRRTSKGRHDDGISMEPGAKDGAGTKNQTKPSQAKPERIKTIRKP